MSKIKTSLAEIRQLPKMHAQRIPLDYLDENQHVNVQYYVHLTEQGLVALFEQVGLGAAYAAATEFGNFALEQHIRYLAEMLLGDCISVYIRLVELSPKRGYFMGFLVNETQARLAATVEIVQMNVEMAERRGAPYPAAAKTQLDALLDAHRRLPWAPPVCGVMRA